MPKIQRALISVHDKTGIEEFAKGLAAHGVHILSTGGTAKALRAAGLKVTDLSEYTGSPEILDGRVKTLHPKVHGGLLYRREVADHVEQVKKHGIEPIDLVCVNLYPFEKTIVKPGVTLEEAIEQIDIGGPSMLRSASKNWESVTVVCDPLDYSRVLDEMATNNGSTQKSTRGVLAAKVFALTSRYDGAIANYLERTLAAEAPAADGEYHAPKQVMINAVLRQSLRYGENPHQRAAFYMLPGCAEPNLAEARQLSGKELSFNNILDLAAALELIREFAAPAACVIKHGNPCGAAVARENEGLLEAFQRAYAGDPLSAFGGIIGLNRKVDVKVAEDIAKPGQFVEAVVAPKFDPDAVQLLTTKPKWGKNVRLLEIGDQDSFTVMGATPSQDIRIVPGGMLVQDRDRLANEWKDLKIVTKRPPNDTELATLKFAQLVCKHVKSNAIVFAKDSMIVGVGAGQTSRVDSVEAAARKAGERAKGAVMASDAFFPFPDGIETAARAGVASVIQPGGSVKDTDAIATCDKLNMAMVFTGIRHFRH